MPSGFSHLTYAERCQIHALNKRGDSIREIGRAIGRSASTVSRELRRNRGGRGYRHAQAQRLAEARRRAVSSVPRKMTAALWALVEMLLGLQWSPEQIAGRLRLAGTVSVSATWIYRYVWADRARGGDLFRHLRRRGKKRNSPVRRGQNGSKREFALRSGSALAANKLASAGGIR